MRLMAIIVTVLVMACSVACASPKLFFSDLISGPDTGLGDNLGDGVIVTMWGYGLGSSQGTSTISICGITPAYIYYWQNADGTKPGGPADLYTYQGMQEIAFSVPAECSTGATTISVTVDSNTSNTLPFTVRSDSIYHVKTSGSSGGDGSWASPWDSLDTARTEINSGDTVYVHDGVLDVHTYDYQTGILFSGVTGSLATQIGIITYPNSRAIARGSGKSMSFYNSDSFVISKYRIECGAFDEPEPEDTDILTGIGQSGTGMGSTENGRYVANYITDIAGKCTSGAGGAIAGAGNAYAGNFKMFGNHIDEWGCNQTSRFEHTVYMTIRLDDGPDVEAWEMGWNLLTDNKARYGLHNYDETYSSGDGVCSDFTGTLKVHDNYIVNQRGAGINTGNEAPVGYVCWTGDIEIYNNVLVNPGLGPADEQAANYSGIQVTDGGLGSAIKIYNNTVYGYGGAVDNGTTFGGFNFTNQGGKGGNATVILSNNIFYDIHGYDYTYVTATQEDGLSGDKNLFYSTDGTNISTVHSNLSDNINSDPLFVSAGSDFALISSSPAVDVGVTGIQGDDIIGTTRPQNSIYDIGAYEYEHEELSPTINSGTFTGITIN